MHGLQARERGLRASRAYAYLTRSDLLDGAAGGDGGLSERQHHDEAAVQHEQAVLHHSQAAGYLKEQNFTLAAREAHFAQGYAQNATFHGTEAARHHVDHFGTAAPADVQG